MNRKSLSAAALFAALAAGACFYWMRPSPLEKAVKALERGDPDAAARMLADRLAKSPPLEEARDLRRELARAYLMKGAWDDAEKTLRSSLEQEPEDAAANLTLGFLLLSRGQESPAEPFLRKAKAGAPSDLRASRGLVALLNARGDHDKAREEALDLLNRAPADPLGRTGLGAAELGLGLFAEAAQTFEAVLAANPSDKNARLSLARARLSAGALNAAEEALAPLLKEAPDNTEALRLQAAYFLARSRPGDAETLCGKVFEKDPRALEAGIVLAHSLARRRDTDRAEPILLDIAQRLPKPDEAPPAPYADLTAPWRTLALRESARRLRVDFNLAMAAVYRARYLLADAERQARLALQMVPGDLAALRTLTDVQRASGDGAEWLKAAAVAAERHPRHPEVMVDKAQALLMMKKPQEAAMLAQAAAAACPALARAWAVLAEARLVMGDKAAAAQAVARGLEANGQEPAARLAEGLLKTARGETSGAEAAFAQAATLDPACARAHWERAKALDRLGRKPAAANARERALALEPRAYAGRP